MNIFKKIYRKITIGHAFNDETVEVLNECLAAEREGIEFEERYYPPRVNLKDERLMRTPFEVEQSDKFKSDLVRMLGVGADITNLERIVTILAYGGLLPKEDDHKLKGEYKGCRGCNVHPNWLLIYSRDDKKLILRELRTGTHSDLF